MWKLIARAQGQCRACIRPVFPIAGTMGSLEGHEYDLVTIGAGSGGTRASRISAQHYGAKVACIELPFGFISSDAIGGAGGT